MTANTAWLASVLRGWADAIDPQPLDVSWSEAPIHLEPEMPPVADPAPKRKHRRKHPMIDR